MNGDPRFLDYLGHPHRGANTVVPVKAPGAGVNWLVTVPGGEMWRVLSLFGLFTTSAVVANRLVTIAYIREGAEITVAPAAAVTAASITSVVSGAIGVTGLTTVTSLTFQSISLPNLLLSSGGQIGASVVGMDPGDSWGAMSLLVDRYYFTHSQLTNEHDERQERELRVQRALLEIAGS